MSSIINLKKEIIKVVLDSDGDLEKMNIDNIIKLSREVELYLQNEEMEFINLKKNNLNNLSEFEEDSNTIFERMRQAHMKIESEKKNNDQERREYLKRQLLNRLKI
jgi:hypothetical protein